LGERSSDYVNYVFDLYNDDTTKLVYLERL
jgi:hypothetical protein